MRDAISEVRVRAEILQKQAQSGDAAALSRFRKLPEVDASSVRRRDCLAVLAQEMGFENWLQAKLALTGSDAPSFGALLCPPRCAAHFNIWCKSREEARQIREVRGGWVLAFRNQFLVVDQHYITTLGLDPESPEWKTLGYDWTSREDERPGSVAARASLYRELIG